ncbi:DUF397 domain-containing protein [Actinomadura fibrosa]|uniref:DUF397 domain-containing protein n=1 Tax=Actinomadura fibrosa TaxID=111802 RepID=A0ABW2XU48_9ACTN
MPNALAWRKSTRSGQGCDCVEAAVAARSVLLRDSKNAAGPRIRLSPPQWRALLARLKQAPSGGEGRC